MSFENGEMNPVSVGPCGGTGGTHWDDGVHSTIRQFVIVHGWGIDSIQIEYDQNGSSVWSKRHGGSGGYKTDKVQLDYPDEFLTSIRGHFGSIVMFGPVFVRSLTFESNRRTYGPYGIEQGTYFSFPNTGVKIVGFHGKFGWYIDSIGAYLKPIHKPNPSESLVHSQSDVTNGTQKIADLSNTLSKQTSSSREFSDEEPKAKSFENGDKNPVSVGPWGSQGGSCWDDGVHSTVRQLVIVHGAGIDSVQIEYDQNGSSVWSERHGGSGGNKTDKVKLDYPDEYLTSIHGHFGNIIIRSLTFESNRKTYGPFGTEQGTYFSFPKNGGKIVGFHGKCGWYINAIGAYLKPSSS